jgi:hypothetical protein
MCIDSKMRTMRKSEKEHFLACLKRHVLADRNNVKTSGTTKTKKMHQIQATCNAHDLIILHSRTVPDRVYLLGGANLGLVLLVPLQIPVAEGDGLARPDLRRHEEERALADDASGQHDGERQDVGHHLEDADDDAEAALVDGLRARVLFGRQIAKHIPSFGLQIASLTATRY